MFVGYVLLFLCKNTWGILDLASKKLFYACAPSGRQSRMEPVLCCYWVRVGYANCVALAIAFDAGQRYVFLSISRFEYDYLRCKCVCEPVNMQLLVWTLRQPLEPVFSLTTKKLQLDLTTSLYIHYLLLCGLGELAEPTRKEY